MGTVKNQIAVITVGRTHSGKSTFAEELAKNLPDPFILNSDPIELFLKSNYPQFYRLNNKPIDNYGHQELRSSVFRVILRFALANGFNIILANANLTRVTRKKSIKIIRARKTKVIKVILVYFNLTLDTLLKRIKIAGKNKNVLTESKNFEALLEKQARIIEIPTPEEGDYFFEINELIDVPGIIRKISELFNNVNKK